MHTELPFCHLMMQFCFPSSHLQITEVCFASESWCQVRLMCSRTRVQGLLFSPPERMVTYEAAQCGLEAWEAQGSHSVGSGADASHPDDGALRSSRQKRLRGSRETVKDVPVLSNSCLPFLSLTTLSSGAGR